jgi:phospholipase/carboxylesterase
MSMTTELSLHHRFVPATTPGRRPLLLLHGTGGNEDDLLPFGRAVAPGAALLSPRGAVREGGMPRFFRRLAEGVFDEDDLQRRTADLAGFIADARDRYGIAAPVAVGFSNGANIAAALLMLHPEALAGAVLLRAMVPFREAPRAELRGKPVVLVSGEADPIVSAGNAAKLAAQLAAAGAAITHQTLPVGHALSRMDVDAVTTWLHGQTHERGNLPQ